ncbi:MAG TPA: site-2 protease family protein [Terriglobales bacterium]|nr:site-2 protease family protein [Terriglobales bacterium]
MKSWSIAAGRIFGIEIRIHLTFLFLLAFVWLTESAARHAPPNPERSLALVGIVFGSVLLHELGHAWVAIRSGVRVKAIILLPIGGVSILDDTFALTDATEGAKNWVRDLRMAAAGPLVNFVIAAIAAGAINAISPETGLLTWPFLTSSNLLRSLVWANLYLAAFNLLPAYPMDGGRVLRALFARRLDSVQATRRAVSISQALAMVLILAGMLHGSNIWLTMVGFFLFIAAQLEERSVVFQSVLATVQMNDIMLTDFATLSPADTLEDALEKAVHCLQDDFPVIRGSDMVGVISRQKILQALRTQGNGYVQSVMSRIFEVAGRGESLASAFRKLTAKNLSLIPVVEDQRLVGIVTLQNLMHSMALLAESRKLRRQASGS